MKALLTKLRSSLARDRAGGAAAGSPSSFQRLDERLRASRPAETDAPQLHDSIMRAVRVAHREERESIRIPMWRWAAMGGGALVLVGVGWLIWSRPPADAARLASQTDVARLIRPALEQGRALAEQTPEVVLAPLSDEMELLHRDFALAVNRMVASMP
jgi:hypothetical protein